MTKRNVSAFRIALVALALTLAPGCGRDGAESGGLRVMSLNLAGGFEHGQYRAPEARAAQRAFIAAQNPDVVLAQEFTGYDAGSFNDDGTILRAYTEALTDDQGDAVPAGVAIWVRPGLRVLESWEVQLDYGDGLSGHDPHPRTSLMAKIQAPSGEVLIVADVHLSVGSDAYMTDIRRTQLLETLAFDPDIVGGDFNVSADKMVDRDPDGTTRAWMQVAADAIGVSPLRSITGVGSADQIWAHSGRGAGNGGRPIVPTGGVAGLVSDHPGAALAKVR